MNGFTRSDKSWMPPHCGRLGEVALRFGAGPKVTPMHWGMSIKASPIPHVVKLTSAASKYRLAYYCTGLNGPDNATHGAEAISQTYFTNYSSQVLIMLSFVALETYLRMLGTDWTKYPLKRSGMACEEISAKVRDDLGEEVLQRLKRAMDSKALKGRIQRYIDGDQEQILAVISALRNSFAHGKMGISSSLKGPCALEVKSFLLDLIVADSDLICRSLEQQDASLLKLS